MRRSGYAERRPVAGLNRKDRTEMIREQGKKQDRLGNFIFAGGIVLGTAADQASKLAAASSLKGHGAVPVLQGIFELLYLENRGAAFGILKNRQWIMILLALAISAGAVFMAVRLPKERRYRALRLALGLLVCGALGNLIDRIARGYVIDFLYFSLIDFPVFNIADIFVCAGCALLLILLLFYYREEDLQIFGNEKGKTNGS